MKKVKPIKCYHCGRILYDEPQISFTIREGMCIDCYDRIREDKECGLFRDSYADFKRDCYDRIREDIDTYLSRF